MSHSTEKQSSLAFAHKTQLPQSQNPGCTFGVPEKLGTPAAQPNAHAAPPPKPVKHAAPTFQTKPAPAVCPAKPEFSHQAHNPAASHPAPSGPSKEAVEKKTMNDLEAKAKNITLNSNQQPLAPSTSVGTQKPAPVAHAAPSTPQATKPKVTETQEGTRPNMFGLPEPAPSARVVSGGEKRKPAELTRESANGESSDEATTSSSTSASTAIDSSKNEHKSSALSAPQSLLIAPAKRFSTSLKPLNVEHLSTMLSCEQAREYFPWIGRFHPEHTILHPSLPYLAVVYNEVGSWNREQILLIASNDDLEDQLNWEVRVALCFRKDDAATRTDLFGCLASIPKEEASVIIGLRTAEIAQEIVLAPSPNSDLRGLKHSTIVEKVLIWIDDAANVVEKKVKEANTRCDEIQALWQSTGLSSKDFWANLNKNDQELIMDLMKARVLLWQLDTMNTYYSPYTGLVHVKFVKWSPSLKETVDSHPLTEIAPNYNTFATWNSGSSTLFSGQYENLRKFLDCVDLIVEVDKRPRPITLNSLERPEWFVPFEILFSHTQETQVGQYMKSMVGTFGAFHFLSSPNPINRRKSFYSIEGIMSHAGAAQPKGAFLPETVTLTMSKYADCCVWCHAPGLAREKCTSGSSLTTRSKK
ncbi:hypothetical protein OXX59_004832 [Metschnikowia pulcherrima]